MEILSEYVREKGMYGASDIVAEIEVTEDNGETVYVQVCLCGEKTYNVSKISIREIDKMSNEDLSKLDDSMFVEEFSSDDETILKFKESKYYELYDKCEKLVDKFEKDKYSK